MNRLRPEKSLILSSRVDHSAELRRGKLGVRAARRSGPWKSRRRLIQTRGSSLSTSWLALAQSLSHLSCRLLDLEAQETLFRNIHAATRLLTSLHTPFLRHLFNNDYLTQLRSPAYFVTGAPIIIPGVHGETSV
jgi:hypothetical protein